MGCELARNRSNSDRITASEQSRVGQQHVPERIAGANYLEPGDCQAGEHAGFG
jgi:hypothetical protein